MKKREKLKPVNLGSPIAVQAGVIAKLAVAVNIEPDFQQEVCSKDGVICCKAHYYGGALTGGGYHWKVTCRSTLDPTFDSTTYF